MHKGKTFQWNEAQQRSFDTLKLAMSTIPILLVVDIIKPFVVETYASTTTVGVVLIQDGRPVALERKKLNCVQCNYLAYERKLFAIIHA